MKMMMMMKTFSSLLNFSVKTKGLINRVFLQLIDCPGSKGSTAGSSGCDLQPQGNCHRSGEVGGGACSHHRLCIYLKKKRTSHMTKLNLCSVQRPTHVFPSHQFSLKYPACLRPELRPHHLLHPADEKHQKSQSNYRPTCSDKCKKWLTSPIMTASLGLQPNSDTAFWRETGRRSISGLV